MAAYSIFTTARTTAPDLVALTTAVTTATGDVTAVLFRLPDGTWRGKKSAAWSAGDLGGTQTALDTTAALTPQLSAQREVDAWPIAYRALVLALIDALNILRAFHSLAAITPVQAITSIRNKAATL